MPQDTAEKADVAPSTQGVTAPPVSPYPSPEASDFPADTQTITVSPAEFARDGIQQTRVHLANPHQTDILHVRLAPGAEYLSVTPVEAALGPKERQAVFIRTDTARARAAVRDGAAPGASVKILYQRLGTHESSGPPAPPQQGAIHVHLPIATCPSCGRSLDAAIAQGDVNPAPDVCPYCYERLRPCPICGSPNSWRARRCTLDPAHVIRTSPDWGVLGGDAAHGGTRASRQSVVPTLARRWSYPNVPPARRESALTWSAPAAAYGLVAAAAATAEGDAHLYAFDARNGAPLYEPFPLPDPVYPDRGGIAIGDGRLFVATVEGAFVCLDALRGTRIWETELGGRVYGAAVPTGGTESSGPVLAAVADKDRAGRLLILDFETGAVLRQAPLTGTPDATPAFADGRAFVHTDDGGLTAVEVATGAILWRAGGDAGFDAAPIVLDGAVFSANSAGAVRRFDAATGAEAWKLAVTRSPLAGTPAGDGALLYLPADDGLYLVSSDVGRSVRRYPLRQPVRSAPVVIGGTILFGGTDGIVYGAAPGQPLERIYEATSPGTQIVAAPAFADGALFVAGTNGVLYALQLGTGIDGVGK